MPDSFPDTLHMPDGARYSARYPMAMAYAAMKHAAQSRKDPQGSPYIGHPVAVSIHVWCYFDEQLHGADVAEDLAIAALLHDVAEDAGGQAALNEVAAVFGERVAQIVDHCSDALPAPGEAKDPWRQRKLAHIERVRVLADPAAEQSDPGTCLVIACDKLHNLGQTAQDYSAQGEASLARFRGGVEGTRWYYRTLRDVLEPSLPQELVAALDEPLRIIGA